MIKASEPSNDHRTESGVNVAADKLSSASDTKAASAEPEKNLTPEEQMALFEKELKENDWGHQPC